MSRTGSHGKMWPDCASCLGFGIASLFIQCNGSPGGGWDGLGHINQALEHTNLAGNGASNVQLEHRRHLPAFQ